jgi:hypothetical protein
VIDFVYISLMASRSTDYDSCYRMLMVDAASEAGRSPIDEVEQLLLKLAVRALVARRAKMIGTRSDVGNRMPQMAMPQMAEKNRWRRPTDRA